MITDPHGAAPARPELDPAEYDFSGVPDAELECCRYYEFMRESEAIVGEVNKVRAQLIAEFNRQRLKPGDTFETKITIKKVTTHQGIMFEGAMIAILAASSVFPTKPWQKLSPSDKDRLRDFPARANRVHNEDFAKKHPMLTLDTTMKSPSLGKSTLNDWKSKRTPKAYQKVPAAGLDQFLATGFIQICLGYSQERLTAAFQDWLKVNCPQVCGPAKERRGRHTDRDPLNGLGALRLRRHSRTLYEAQALIAPLAAKPHGMSYRDRTAWNRACDGAVEHFRWILKLPEGHLPICFTEGWQK